MPLAPNGAERAGSRSPPQQPPPAIAERFRTLPNLSPFWPGCAGGNVAAAAAARPPPPAIQTQHPRLAGGQPMGSRPPHRSIGGYTNHKANSYQVANESKERASPRQPRPAPRRAASRQKRRELYSWKMKILWGIHANALAYSMTTLGAGMMNSIFNFYYVKLFLNRYKISETGFHVAQVVFMVWNAINDPLFGYIQDNSRLKCCARRQFSILYGAPLYGLAFLLPWFPWRQYQEGDWLCGLHLVVALCAFDGLLTFVLLAQCALFAESSGRHDGRLRLIKYNQVATLMGSTSVLFCGLVSDNMENFAYFQAFAVLVAALATACMCCTGKYSTSQYERREIHTEEANLENSDGAFSLASVVSLTKQIMTEKNFLCFVTMNFFQVFHLAFYNNFMMIFADNLIPKDVLSSSVRSVMYGAGFICPQCLVLLSHASLKKFGYYRIILFSFYYEGVAAAVMCLLGQEHYYLLAFYVTTNIIAVVGYSNTELCEQ
ncbi:transmembrane protein 180-like isoform X5 [Motacilla alba alba]|uniref:transmembrane protein 180-like isoform X5 n=1 Tax=Motacilla alba alba TaxID=1094192 RepID=UPI0018D50F9B|nr:transmembrane protein 180-like isoform X5 [Motacilla alba alba]